MSDERRPPAPEDYEVIVICALREELDAVQALFEQDWEEVQQYPKARNDPNAYAFGRIGKHNIAVTKMPGMGKKNSTSVASHLPHTFPHIRLGLVVGICGGVPSDPKSCAEIIRGDVIISTAVIQYDFGWQYSDKFVKKDTLQDNLGRPNAEILSFLEMMQGRFHHKRLKQRTFAYLDDLLKNDEFQLSRYPGIEYDILFRPEYRHKHQNAIDCQCANCENPNDGVCDEALMETCEHCQCDVTKKVHRRRLSELNARTDVPKPEIHFGEVASGDAVMKSGYHRDWLAKNEQVIGFEMEGAGVWENFPTIVVKSVADYSDSHKDYRWQSYAAACAAACMKALLEQWRVTDHTRPTELGRTFLSPMIRQVTDGNGMLDVESVGDRAMPSKDKIIDAAITTLTRIHQRDEGLAIKEDLDAAQRNFIEALSHSSNQGVSTRHRLFWGLMIVRRRLSCYKEFNFSQRIEHIEMAESFSNDLRKTLIEPGNPSLNAQVTLEQTINWGIKTILKAKQKGRADEVKRANADAARGIDTSLEELKKADPASFSHHSEAAFSWRTKFSKNM
ncbi:hypothetical protein ACLMJK_007476 [Lecanora helva]